MAKKQKTASFQPLYFQIKEMIVERVKSGEWKEGEPLPSEFEFARLYNVSQGTVRKAIAEMADEKLVVRFRGKGTFVATHTNEREHSHFFHIVGNDCVKRLPGTRMLTCYRQKATKDIQAHLDLAAGAPVVVLERLRIVDDKPIIFETITVSEKRFPGLCSLLEDQLPNELYPLYESKYKTRVIRAEECIRSITANEREAEALGIEVGMPLLEIDRVAISINDKPVEWRRSHCFTQDYHYQNSLS
ncbi:MAG: GntR family transcriptional regulator [Rhodospirillales bacterium]|nr:GntR family transcriptional regulator [Rhodospirillales bacterium]